MSQVIHFPAKKRTRLSLKDISNLEKITQLFFSNKRKMINKKIKSILLESEIKKIRELKLNLKTNEPKNLKSTSKLQSCLRKNRKFFYYLKLYFQFV